MFAIVRTGGKQYRVSAGDKIAVEKLAGNAGDTIDLGDVILAGDGGELKDVAKIKVAAEIIAQAKSEKVTVFKKRRRHNYRRKAGHRQQLTLLRIVQVGDSKIEKAAAPKKEAAPKAEAPAKAAKAHEAEKSEPAKGVDTKLETKAQKAEPVKKAATAAKADEKPAAKKAATEKKPAAAKAPAAKKPAAKKPAPKK
ncbi:MAG: 50S ribosomal protein L21 [Croceibacterium sp.]|nr:50S ribosomal protein L21 [Croceibacterium sp.]